MQGKIIRGVGGFYYVHVPSIGLLECKAKGAFRNRRVKPLVGDNVDVTILDEANALGNIEEILPRHSELIRPALLMSIRRLLFLQHPIQNQISICWIVFC